MSDLKSDLGLITEAELADLRGIKVRTLRDERSRGVGPPYTKIGKAIFYPLKSLREYTAKRAVVPTKANTLVNGRGRKTGTAA